MPRPDLLLGEVAAAAIHHRHGSPQADTTRRCGPSTRERGSPSATASSPSPPTPRACRRSPTLRRRRSRCGTLARARGWHTLAQSRGLRHRPLPLQDPRRTGGEVDYAASPMTRPYARDRAGCAGNPHRLHLGARLQAVARRRREAAPRDVTGVEQTLDLGACCSRAFSRLEGQPVAVETLCHPRKDAIAVRVRSPLVASGRLQLRLRFPYQDSERAPTDWTEPDAHTTARSRFPARAHARSAPGRGHCIESRLAAAPPARSGRGGTTPISW